MRSEPITLEKELVHQERPARGRYAPERTTEKS